MKRAFQTASLSALAAALGFYLWQNGFAANGGSIALPKALWLGMTVLYWLILPPLVFSSSAVSGRLKTAYLLFWLPMLVRGLIEILLMYGTNTWKYGYGIIHDLFSLALLLPLGLWCRREQPRLLAANLGIMAAMFAAEAWFANYISAFNQNQPHARLWFIGWEAPHFANQAATALLVSLLAIWLICLTRKLP